MEVAALGLKVEGVESIESATTSLGKLQKTAEVAEKSVDAFGVGSRRAFSDAAQSVNGFQAIAARAAREAQYLAQQVSKLSDYEIRNNDIQAFGTELDRLRAKYNPLFAASKAYEKELDELNRAHRVGAIDAREHAAALTTLNSRFQQSTSQANAASINYQSMGNSMSGLAAQFQDIGVTAAMGMNPLIIGLQQGTQIAGQMEAAMSRGASATGVFAAAFKSLLGPVTAASIGLTVLASALIQAVDWAKAGKYALKGLADVVEVIAPYAAVAAAGLAVLYAPTILSGIASVTTALLSAGKAALTAAAAFALANPAVVFVAGFAAAVTALYVFRDAVKKAVGVDVIGIIKDAANYVINSFVAAYEDIKFVWNNFGNMMGAAVIGGVNIAIRAINKLVQAAIKGVNGLIGLLNSIPGVDIGSIGESLGVSEIANPYEKLLGASVAERNKKLAEIMGRDSIGAFVKGAQEAGDKAADWLRKLTFGDDDKKKGSGKSSELANIVKQLQLQHATLGMTAEQAARYEIEMAKGSETDRKRALTLYDQIQAWNETEKAMQAAIDSSRQYLAFQQEMDVFQQKLNLDSAGVGMGDRQRELAQADLAIRQEYAQKRLDLEMAQQVKETALTQEQYQYRLDLFQQFEEQKLAGLQQSAEARAIAEADWTNGMSRAWDNFATKAQDIAGQTEAIFTGMLNSFSSGFGNAFEKMVFDSENLGDAMRNVAQGMARAVVNALAQMAAQWLAYQAVQLIVGKTTQASSAMAISANAHATALQAGLAAFASTAAIPVVGPAAAPAAMGAALAVATPLATAISMTAMAGMAHDGIDSVPQTGTWLLEKGERVTTAKTSARLDSVLERIDARQRAGRAFDGQAGSSSKSEPRVVVQLMGSEFQGAQVTEERGSTDEELIVRVVSRDFLQGGRTFDALQSVSNVRRVGA
ncbi:phage tail tape measure C-terminal domain-containing protein [Alcaligenes faecalis]|uniref:phage tail tape measure C-terminal domain-containing protein n=1 Tax=Alcaligenes faecalis TaxID=511 RepID=UPI0029336DF5|nr:phage tail tape measure C-terminal domain-containing protein [Alcaligenes faecalis]MDV2115365.1 phage tail tape measure C-terminal domain-containing protein [Alcaligenes faecalis]